MGTESNTLLVTWDFSPVSEYALEYATVIAKKLFKVIQLIHVIKPNLPQPEKERIRQELSTIT
ncbi:MAG: universal stress protein, partial [Bacteroidota bacterium]|nr:universal stress protein [Bacteroidota bacterium]